MIVYAVQWHRAPLPPHDDEEDLDWTTWPGHDDYRDEGEANAAAREFDAAFDGSCVHRVVAQHVDGPGVARAGRAAGLSTPAEAAWAQSSSAQHPGRTRR
jgi:hypothetical protein